MAADGAADEVKPQAGRRGGRGPRAIVVYVAMALVILLALGIGKLGLDWRSAQLAAADESQALQAARQTGVNLVTLNHETLDEDIDRILQGTTGHAKDSFGTQSERMRKSVTEAKTRSSLDTVHAGLVRIGDDSAEAIVSVDATVTGTDMEEGQTRTFRYAMNLEKTDGEWLVSRIGIVS